MSLTIKQRVTLWYALIMTVIGMSTVAILIVTSENVATDYYRDTLISTANLSRDDIYYENGELEIDRHMDELPEVRVAIYDMSGNLIYGKTRFEADFDFAQFNRAEGRTGGIWYYCDTLLEPEGGQQIVLRLYISADASGALFTRARLTAFIIIPFLIIAALIGGYLITRGAFKPITKIAETAEAIADGRDLKKRIALGDKKDEIYFTAYVFDNMIERLEKSFDRERRFVSDASHELRTPIAAIMSVSDISDTATADDMRKALSDINARSRGMSALVGQLLSLTRMEEGRVKIDIERVDLREMCEGIAEGYANVNVAADGDCICECDQSLITRVVMNLLDNAVKYGRENGASEIILSGDNVSVFITVRDDGDGIPEDALPHIFERFYQADHSRSRNGSGLGLAMVKQIAELHSGEVFAKNDSGAVFTVKLPRVWAKGVSK